MAGICVEILYELKSWLVSSLGMWHEKPFSYCQVFTLLLSFPNAITQVWYLCRNKISNCLEIVDRLERSEVNIKA